MPPRRMLAVALAVLLWAAPAAAREGGAADGWAPASTFRSHPLPRAQPGPREQRAGTRPARPARTLRYGTARAAGLRPGRIGRIAGVLRGHVARSPQDTGYAGGVVLAARHGVVAVHAAAGWARRYADDDTVLPRGRRIPARRDTVYDLASLTKMFTAIAALQQVEAGRLDLDAPVARYLPAFARHGKQAVTVRHLLTHTGGLPGWRPLYARDATPRGRFAAALSLKPEAPPGTEYEYSDPGMVTLGLLVERVTGKGLDEVVADGITGPLRMRDTMFTPPASLRRRIAATEYQPELGRGMVWGEVHDENAWALGGVAGHAGLFSTAHDVAVLAQTLLDGGRHGRTRILRASTVRAMLRNHNAGFPGDAHGLGFELNQRRYMGPLASPVTFGHTGYTGTSLVVDPAADAFVVLLTNTVHPSRSLESDDPVRRAVARVLARSLVRRGR
jgi:CubicO group peptidase (beta-lactamase class C family)